MTDFERVFEDNRGFVFKYLLKLSGSASLAEELTQETFFRAYVNFSSIRNRQSCSSWLCQTAKNCYFAWYNEQKKLAPLYEDSALSPDPIDEAGERELTRLAEAEVEKLEEPYREVFKLAVLGGASLKEISGMFGKSESWARVTYYRARKKLAERMEKYGL
ncbi:MAG: RNA polymerase sigma factor [Clostridia bacterium]|nr:RNA polymerase sigma factor [Clostridia bacterium]